MQNQKSVIEVNRGEVGAIHEEFKHANSKYMKNNENEGESEDDDITWSQVFNMMYNDAKEIISPISKIVNYVAPDPNEEDSRQARAAFEEKMSKQVKQPIRKYKIGSPGAIHMYDKATGEIVSIPRRENLFDQQSLGADGNTVLIKKRGLLGNLKEENVKDPMEIIESAQNIESFTGTVQEIEKEKGRLGLGWQIEGDQSGSYSDNSGSRRHSSPGIKNTPSTQCNTDSSPCTRFEEGRNGKEERDRDIYEDEKSDQVDKEDSEYYDDEINQGMRKLHINNQQKGKGPGAELVIPRLSLTEKRRSISKKCSEEDLATDKDHALYRMHSERRLNYYKNRSDRVPHGNYHSHAYTMENLASTIQRPITTSREEILKLYTKEELNKIQSFVEKANELVYEGPLEKKNSWSWGHKLRWVKLYKCEMHYFLSPKESNIRSKTPLGVINFKVAEWSLQISDSDERTFTIAARGNTSNGRGYQWRIPTNSEQSRKSWTTRIEKILKAAAFMQQLKGIIRIPA
ncbi:pleckstrin domain-containing protein [Cryptosporidium ubiquitum]|uniref:Pleckstrin domain-containing protein n=1 Tax=Cryptosporidium ubiquitum TaxID=857276 RepID=A0A1J4MGE0_9CRYT|nr:pleckstrin domain-containing protein [Cryptosporidium ubiquitum]OII73289.1 pleckstrin domain-containing protein [Cryptosporidium ubiquitum]